MEICYLNLSFKARELDDQVHPKFTPSISSPTKLVAFAYMVSNVVVIVRYGESEVNTKCECYFGFRRRAGIPQPLDQRRVIYPMVCMVNTIAKGVQKVIIHVGHLKFQVEHRWGNGR